MNKLAPQTVMFFILCILISEGFAQDGWILRKSGTGRKLRSIASGDGQNVVAVGDSGVVTTSSDAGVTWELQKRITWNSPFTGGNPNFSASDTNVNGVTAVTGKIFCAVGDKDSVFRSIDGGHSWHGVVSRAKSDCPLLVPELPLKELRAIDFDTSLKLCIAIGDRGEVIFSSDSGKHWYENLPLSYESYQSVSSFRGHSLVGGWNGQVAFTSNQGDTWISEWVQVNPSINGSDMQGLTVVGQAGYIFHTPNKGFTWDSISSGTSVNLNAVHFGNIVRGYAVGDSGTILMTTDGGYTWAKQYCPTTQNLRSVHMFDPFHGFICGDSGVILTTQNGGYFDQSVDPLPVTLSPIRNYPNPFSLRTTVEIAIPHTGYLRLKIYDVLGKEVATLAEGAYESGLQSFEWNAGEAPSGIYICNLELGGKYYSSQITLEK